MEKENRFREVFKDFEKNPSDKVWANIEKGINPDFIQKPSLFKTAKFWISSGLIIGIATFLSISLSSNKQIKSELQSNNFITENLIDNQENKIIDSEKPTAILTLQKEEKITDNITKKADSESEHKANHNSETQTNATSSNNANISKEDKKTEENRIEQTTTNQLYNSKLAVTSENNTLNSLPQSNQIIKKNNVVNISFSANQTICKGDKVKLFVNGGVNYLWSTGEKTQSILVNPTLSTDYSVIATDENGNQKTGLISVEVSNCQTLFVPNAFTPNGDGQHDEFKAIGNGIQKFEMIIVSRSGQIVFSSNNIDKGWDGSFKGNPVEMGTYVYSIKYIDELNKPHTINGHVSVIR